MLGRRLTESEFSQAYGLLFEVSGSPHDCLSHVRNLDQRSLKQAYRRRAQETHPDRAHSRGASPSHDDPEEAFRSVVAAYELLKLVQQGAVDVHLITRGSSAGYGQRTQASEHRTARTGPNPRQRQREAHKAAHEKAHKKAHNHKEAHARPEPKPEPRPRPRGETTGRERSAYTDRSAERARDWGRFWQQTETASKFSPDSDHYFEQQMPTRQLPFGQYLYYTGMISWRQLIDALVWQRQQRPMIGQLARNWGMLTAEQVQSVLEHRRSSGRYDVKFADFAEELGFLTEREKLALCGRMKMMQKPIGQFFVDRGVFTQAKLNDMLSAHRRHNWRAMQRRSVSS